MSYILDALKKSEKERQRGMVPDLSTVQDITMQGPNKRSLWPYLLLVALLLNAGIILWLAPLQSKKQNIIVQSSVKKQSDLRASVSASPEPTKINSPTINSPEAASTKSKTAVTKQTQPIQEKTNTQRKVPYAKESRMTPSEQSHQPPAINHTPSEPKPDINIPPVVENRIYNLNELPSSIQRGLPAFSISAHIYSDDPASRMVRINGQMVREGQILTADLKLEKITADGVTLSYHNYRFHVGLK